MRKVRIFVLGCIVMMSTAQFSFAESSNNSAKKRTIAEYFKDDTLITNRQAFYNADKTQRVEYHCEDENGPGGENEGASNPANVHCEATLFIRQSGDWLYGDEISLRYGSVKEFAGHKLVIEVLEYGEEDALCCPSESSTQIFNTESGRLVEDITSTKNAQIVQAVKDGADQKRVAELLSQGNDINAKDKYDQTALMIAAETANVDIMKLLLTHNADVNATRNNGKTALIIAAGKGSAEIVKLLLDKGANPNLKSDEGRFALYYAIQSGNADISRLLIERGADVNAKTVHDETALMEATQSGRDDLVRLLLEKGADIHAMYEGETALVAAVKRSSCKIARMLLDKGVSANERNWALMRGAAYSRDTDCLQALIEKGTDINAKDSGGQTPLFNAAQYGPVANVEWLLKHGANPDVIANGRTPLEAARRMGKKDVVEFLEKQKPRQ